MTNSITTLSKYTEVFKHYDIQITAQWGIICAWYIYEESTADGYTIYVSTSDPYHVNISEDLYYYESELSDAIISFFETSIKGSIIYIEDISKDYVKDALEYLNKELKQTQNPMG